MSDDSLNHRSETPLPPNLMFEMLGRIDGHLDKDDVKINWARK